MHHRPHAANLWRNGMSDTPAASSAIDKRRGDRKELLTQAIFVSQHVRLKSAVTIDISTCGLSLTVPEAMKVGRTCAISFDVPTQNSKQRTLIQGTIASCVGNDADGYRIGVQYQESDPVSRQLIEAAVDHYLQKT
jgi:hypothetical protein